MKKAKVMSAAWFVEESLRYERALTTLYALRQEVYLQRIEDRKQAKADHVDPDGSLDLVVEQLDAVKKSLQEAAEVLWKEAERRCTVPDSAIEDLLNSVLTRATSDYEAALSGFGTDGTMAEVEHFFRTDAELLTTADVTAFLPRIKLAHMKFSELVRDKKMDIISETNEKRKKNGDMRSNHVKCPLCGSGLYEYGTGVGGRHLIRCTGCNLSEMVFL